MIVNNRIVLAFIYFDHLPDWVVYFSLFSRFGLNFDLLIQSNFLLRRVRSLWLLNGLRFSLAECILRHFTCDVRLVLRHIDRVGIEAFQLFHILTTHYLISAKKKKNY